MNGHRIQWNGHRIQWNGHQIQWNGHQIQWNGHRIQMNSHWNQEEIGRNNHLQTLFHTHSYIRPNCHWFRWMVIEIRNNLVETITSKHYFTLTPLYCHIGKRVQQNPITSKHYITLSKKLQAKPSQECERVWERKKDGLALKIRWTVISVLVV